MSQKSISVIIPCYNGAKFIGNCLEMMQAQTIADQLEVLVILDGCTDESEAIARKFPFKIIKFEKNRGLSAARNAGMAAAGAKYIHFMDVDDNINDGFYENMLDSAEKSGADMVLSGMYNYAKTYQSQLFFEQEEYVTLKEKLQITLVGQWGYVWRYLFSKDFLEKHRLSFEEGRLIEDLLFSVRAVYFANKIVSAPDTVYLYSQTPDSILNSKDSAIARKRHEDWVHAKDLVIAFCNEHKFTIQGLIDKGHNWNYIKHKYKTIFALNTKHSRFRKTLEKLVPDKQ